MPDAMRAVRCNQLNAVLTCIVSSLSAMYCISKLMPMEATV